MVDKKKCVECGSDFTLCTMVPGPCKYCDMQVCGDRCLSDLNLRAAARRRAAEREAERMRELRDELSRSSGIGDTWTGDVTGGYNFATPGVTATSATLNSGTWLVDGALADARVKKGRRVGFARGFVSGIAATSVLAGLLNWL